VIPKYVPPLTDLTVLVTRPQPQCGVLCAEIERQGGQAEPLPAIVVRPLEAAAVERADLIVFVSVHAVEHGARLVQKPAGARVAAIGRATAAALAAADLPVDIVPDSGFDSEALLAHPALEGAGLQRIVIVRGEGGRELLRDTFAARGAVVETREVYRRERPEVDPSALARIESLWADGGVDVVSLTSVQTLEHLQEMLTPSGRELLRQATLLLASRRIMEAARAAGLQGDAIIAPGADDAAMVGALAQWRARARSP
jgi:uroporphyrinogen-III synthase